MYTIYTTEANTKKEKDAHTITLSSFKCMRYCAFTQGQSQPSRAQLRQICSLCSIPFAWKSPIHLDGSASIELYMGLLTEYILDVSYNNP